MAALTSAQRMMALFQGHSKAHGSHGMPTQAPGEVKWHIKSTAVTNREPVTLALWELHLKGEKPLGVIPIKEDSTCLWGSIDIDEYHEELLGVVRLVEDQKLPLVPCRSKSGGLHLFLFLAEPQTAAAVQAALREVAARLGLSGSEIFPKQTQVLTDKGDVGNWMVMPYYGGTYGGKLREQVGVKKSGAEMLINEFLKHAEAGRVTSAQFAKLAAPQRRNSTEAFADGPPCLQHLARSGFPDGSHNNALFMIGLYLKRAFPQDWQKRLDEANGKNKLKQKPDEVAQLIKSLEKKDYEYKCKDEPMVSYCDSTMCRTRKWGVGQSGNFPAIAGLSKLNTDPAIWFVDVEETRIELSTVDLQRYDNFHRICMDKVGKCYRPMKQETWYGIISAALENVTIIEAPPEVSTGGKFHELLEEFLTNRARGSREEDLLSRRPWEDEEAKRHYFRLTDLQTFLTREGMRELTRGQITQLIVKMGGGHDAKNIKKKFVRVWWVPSAAVHAMPTLDTPPKKEEPI